ncbi:unnamed protein product [Colias eurytheme]|nr:unnamed protein product [Colias eurytheme]
MEPEGDRERRLSDDVVTFLRKRSDHDAPRYAARIKTYLEMNRKRRRATEARRNSEHEKTSAKKKGDAEQNDKKAENSDMRGNDDDRLSKRHGEKCTHRGRSASRAGSEPADACCRRRRRRRRSCRVSHGPWGIYFQLIYSRRLSPTPSPQLPTPTSPQPQPQTSPQPQPPTSATLHATSATTTTPQTLTLPYRLPTVPYRTLDFLNCC